MTNSNWLPSEAEAAMSLNPHAQANIAGTDPGVSPDEYLLRVLEGHIAGEAATLAEYRALAKSTQDPVVELIMGLVLEDEERHHTLMNSLAARIKDDLYWKQTPGALPPGTPTAADQETYESLRRFVANERFGIHELEEFAGRADGLHGGLPTEILEMMALDSQKHEHLLRFLFRRVGMALRDAR